MLSYFRTILHCILLALLFQKGLVFYKTGFWNLSVEEVIFFSALMLLSLNYGSKKTAIEKSNYDDSEYEDVSWSEYWDRYEKEESIIADIFAWSAVLLPFLIFIYGFYQNETVYLWSKYAIILLQIIGILFLISISSNAIIKLILSDKVLNIVSLVINLIIMIIGIYVGDWVLVIVMFVGFMIFMNKVFA